MTPLDVDMYESLLKSSQYHPEKSKYLVEGFRHGFSLKYQRKLDSKQLAPNLKIRVGSPVELWNKVMKEVGSGRYAGPFETPPFEYFIQSPIGLVPKDQGRKTRLIFHLSYPREGNSVNSGIPAEYCTVKYPDFEDVVKLCMQQGVPCHTEKSDMSMAFHNVPLRPDMWPLLVLKAKHPITGVTYFFVDKCLPFGASISCAIFQDFSDSVAHLVTYRTGEPLINYLDDFFFAALLQLLCNTQVYTFLEVCRLINFPVSIEKTYWGTVITVFLRLLIDTEHQVVRIPKEKIDKVQEQIRFFLNMANKKTTVHRLQKLKGFLNFLCHCVIPGRAFTRRLYQHVSSKMLPHHHVHITSEMRDDLRVWDTFLSHPQVFNRPFIEFGALTADDIQLTSDASKSKFQGMGAVCQNDWMFQQWNPQFIESQEPSIEYLELYGVTAAVLTWIHRFKNRRIYLFCNNMNIVHMINNSSLSCAHCMKLIRLITLEGLLQNVRILAKHISTRDNYLSDSLSRLQFRRFWRLVPASMHKYPTPVPMALWPMSKVW